MRIVILALVTGFLFNVHSGCRSAQTEGQAAPEPPRTVWSQEQLEAHLRILNSSEVEGRGTGTHGYARAAEYVTAQMEGFQLQPAIGSEYRLLYPVSLNYVQSAQLAVTGRDTLHFGPGIDFLADARSDSGVEHVRHLLRLQGEVLDELPGRLAEGTAVLIPSRPQSDTLLVRLRAAGARVVFIEGELVPSQVQRPIKGVLVVRLTPATLEHIEARLASGRSEAGAEVQLIVRVVSGHQPAAGAINVLGYLAGKHPVLSEELVIVCADLDAMGQVGGVQTVDFKHFGMDVSAMLEVARVQAEASRVFSVPDRTVLFAAWAGGRLDHAGFQGYLSRPVWPLEATHSIIYLGLDPEDEPALREQLARHGITLYAIPSPDLLANPAVRLVPSSTQKRMAVSGDAAEEVEVEVGMSQMFERASVLAERVAEEVNNLLLRLAISASPGGPVFESELRVPTTATSE